MRTILRIWILATVAFLAGALIWAFAPLLVPVLMLTVGLGVIVAAIVSFARWVESKRGRRNDV
ncbi:MAG: hypothetical protein AB7E81_00315 [Hyphomicrobiaceae bacterium]